MEGKGVKVNWTFWKKKPETVMRVVCGWHKKNFGFDLEMKPKDGRGEAGITSSICKKCLKIDFPNFRKKPGRWNLVGRFLARRRREKRAAKNALAAVKQAEELERLEAMLAGNPGLHGLILLRGQRGRHYILTEDLAEVKARAASDPEMKGRWN